MKELLALKEKFSLTVSFVDIVEGVNDSGLGGW